MKGSDLRKSAPRTTDVEYTTVNTGDRDSGASDVPVGTRGGVSGDPVSVTILCITLTWAAMDGYVIYNEETNFWKYLTNWVWMIGGCIRAWMLVSRVKQANTVKREAIRDEQGNPAGLDGQVLAPLWTALGVAQVAVMATFFVILLTDSAIVEYHLNKKDSVRCDQIIGWNHLRHVTPVIFHFVLTLCDGAWFTDHVQGKERGCPGCTGYSATWQAAVIGVGIPIIGSVVYMLSADEQDVYHWRHDVTGTVAGITFGASCLIGGFIYLSLIPEIMHTERPTNSREQLNAKMTPILSPDANEREDITRRGP